MRVTQPSDSVPLSLRSLAARRFGAVSWVGFAAWIIVIAFLLLAVFGPLFIATDPLRQTPGALLPIGSPGHPLGTDNLGRDELSRLVHGARPLIGIALLSTLFAALIGTTIGLIAGYSGGWIDQLLMRTTDLVLAFPSLLLIILLVSVTGAGPFPLVTGITVAMAPSFARLVRALCAREMARDYVTSATLAGTRAPRIMLVEILPNLTGPLLVQVMTTISVAAGFSAGMSYIGLGIQPPQPDWGYMVQAAQQFIYSQPSLIILPATCTLLFVVACNFVGDDLRDRFDLRRDL
ncbi:ABC transporter permease [Lacisediminihabitans profunda]|uniref:ABC transporter permease n=1 Tax=Lacisediminihabitans profunda TaxID=2594790 RepID=A0A5C8UQ36_9MICO|nr:ABC transporter permease [Lacisediminihabitans profunda]TXN30399.1 ABC transporter permease [Lacisediminihabitans profunda]